MMNTVKYYLPGVLLIALAVMVMAVPEILVGMVASFIAVLGISALHIGHRIRRYPVNLAYRTYDDRYVNSPFFRATGQRFWF